MRDTLLPLIDRALASNPRPLEFYLRSQSRLPGPRANLELANDIAHLLAIKVKEHPDQVWALLAYLISDDRESVESNTPAEFVILGGLAAYGACAAIHPEWREETFTLLDRYASSTYWRAREGVVIAFQHLLLSARHETIGYITQMVCQGDYFQQRAAVAAISEPALLHAPEAVDAALEIQRIALEHLRSTAPRERKCDGFRVLRQSLGYTLSVVTAAAPEEGFALMRQCVTWGDQDIAWVLRENLKKKRLAKYAEHMQMLSQLLARP